MSQQPTRLELIARVARLVQQNIVKNRNVYNGMFAPNMQSIIDIALLPDELFDLQKLSEQLTEFEHKMELTDGPIFTSVYPKGG